MARKRFTVTYEFGEQAGWVASVKEIPGCHTQGKGIQQTRKRVREALSLWIGDASADKAVFVEEFPILAPTRRVLETIEEVEEEVAELREKQEELAGHRAKAAQQLVDRGFSYRDIAELLRLSFQRVAQLLEQGSAKNAGGRSKQSIARAAAKTR